MQVHRDFSVQQLRNRAIFLGRVRRLLDSVIFRAGGENRHIQINRGNGEPAIIADQLHRSRGGDVAGGNARLLQLVSQGLFEVL